MGNVKDVDLPVIGFTLEEEEDGIPAVSERVRKRIERQVVMRGETVTHSRENTAIAQLALDIIETLGRYIPTEDRSVAFREIQQVLNKRDRYLRNVAWRRLTRGMNAQEKREALERIEFNLGEEV